MVIKPLKSFYRKLSNIFCFREWTEYAINLSNQLGIKNIQQDQTIGKNLKLNDIEKFNSEQIVQLHELYLASKGQDNELEDKKG